MKLLQFPQGAAWRAWRSNTIPAIVSAAGRRDDVAREWILKVETADPADLEDPGLGWVTLDQKLAAALTNIASGELGRHVTQHSTAQHSCVEQHGRACDRCDRFPVLRIGKQRTGDVRHQSLADACAQGRQS